MARYNGPKTRLSRKFGEPLFGPDKVFERRNFLPGQHGKLHKRAKSSVYGMQLAEKQKVKYIYGVLERQFRRIFHEAARRQGVTGTNLLQLLETRLDNIVYRLGIAPTRPAARQLVTHKHIMVNGVVTNIPSFQCKPGDIIEVRERSKSLEAITNSVSRGVASKCNWLEFDEKLLTGKLMNFPQREEIYEKINEHLIVELYSK